MSRNNGTTIRVAAVLATCAAAYGLGAAGCAAIFGIEDAHLYQPDAGMDAGNGGNGGADAAPPTPCTTPADCPAGDACSAPVCLANQCGLVAASAGIACLGPSGEAYVCDGAGECVECLSNGDCAANQPMAPVCDLAQRKCVSCSDGVKNGKEEDVDCGGPDCAACLGRPCHAQLGCAQGSLCALPENVCCATVCGQKCEACSMARTGQPDGTCAPVLVGEDPDGECAMLGGCGAAPGKCRCQDGVKNGDETDVDCGGAACAGCGGGKTCGMASDCAANVPECVQGACCINKCSLPCTHCDLVGQCALVPAGFEDSFCGPTKACGANGAGCVGKAGTVCASGSQCLSGICVAMKCAQSALSQPCNTTADCAAGTCQSYVCQ